MNKSLDLSRRWVWAACGAILLIPAVGTLVSDEINWTPFDFVFAAVLLCAVGVGYELAVCATASRAYRLASLLAIVGCVVLVAGNAAVGIVGNENNPINQWFMLVPLTGLVGALWVRFRPAGMARALLAMAAAQVLASIAVFALSGVHTFVLMGVFAALWLWASRLFKKSAAEFAPAGTIG